MFSRYSHCLAWRNNFFYYYFGFYSWIPNLFWQINKYEFKSKHKTYFKSTFYPFLSAFKSLNKLRANKVSYFLWFIKVLFVKMKISKADMQIFFCFYLRGILGETRNNLRIKSQTHLALIYGRLNLKWSYKFKQTFKIVKPKKLVREPKKNQMKKLSKVSQGKEISINSSAQTCISNFYDVLWFKEKGLSSWLWDLYTILYVHDILRCVFTMLSGNFMTWRFVWQVTGMRQFRPVLRNLAIFRYVLGYLQVIKAFHFKANVLLSVIKNYEEIHS